MKVHGLWLVVVLVVAYLIGSRYPLARVRAGLGV